MKEKKKYIIKESELKEIVKEMILMELYDPNDYKDMYTQNYKGRVPNLGDVLNGGWNMIKGIPGAITPESWKEKVQSGDNDFLRWLFGAMGMSQAGSTGQDYLPDLRSLKAFGGNGWGNGNNYDAHEVFDPNLAVRGILGRATPRYIKGQNGNCGRAVRQALNDGGLTCPWGMNGRYAKNYVNILPNNGWQEIAVNMAGQPGDVVVMTEFQGHPYGHIAMCVGGGRWVSDFVQNSMLGINGNVPQGCIHTYRYTNIKGQQRPQ